MYLVSKLTTLFPETSAESVPYTNRIVVVWPFGLMRPVTVVAGVLRPVVGRITSAVAITPEIAAVVKLATSEVTEAALLPATTL